MLKRNKIYIIAAIVVVIALAITGIVVYNNSNNYVASVAGEKITKTEYNFFLGLAKYQLGSTLGITDWNSKVGNDRAEDLAKNMALDNAREFKIELIQAKQSNISMSSDDEKMINTYFDSMIEQYGGRTKADEQVKAQLGIDMAQYKKIYRNVQLTYKFRDEEQKKIQPTDDEIKKFYDANKDNVDNITVRHILFSIVDAENNPLSEDKQKEAEKKANDILARVKAGEDMKALAKEFSEDPGVSQNEGQYIFTKAESANYAKEFQEWSWAHNIGEAGIAKTDFGFHVIKVEDKKTSFDELKDIAKNGAIADGYTQKLETWKKDPQYNAVKNQKVFDSIKIQ